jgi:uncharacterized membrane protein YedE/YeeE
MRGDNSDTFCDRRRRKQRFWVAAAGPLYYNLLIYYFLLQQILTLALADQRRWKMTEFEPVAASIGGILIGTSAILLLWLTGRIAGISGILYGIFTRESAERHWRLLFVVGLMLGGFLYQFFTHQPLTTRTDFPLPLLVSAGILVGIGTRLGSGCTSGHGVCGISRLSNRSIAATLTFMLAGIATVAIVRMLTGSPS